MQAGSERWVPGTRRRDKAPVGWIAAGALAISSLAGVAWAANELATVAHQLQVKSDDVAHHIASNLQYGSFTYPQSAKAVPVAKRAAVVRAVGAAVKAYLASPAWITRYGELRNEQRPELPTEAMTPAEVRKTEIDTARQTLAALTQECAKAQAELKRGCDQGIAETKRALAELERAPVPRMEELPAEDRDAILAARKRFDAQVAQWNAEWPAGNAKPMLQRRLREFLAETRDIDWQAKLVKNDADRMVFANADYEGKSSGWKAAFRAGREATEASRSLAEGWLRELDAKPAAAPAK